MGDKRPPSIKILLHVRALLAVEGVCVAHRDDPKPPRAAVRAATRSGFPLAGLGERPDLDSYECPLRNTASASSPNTQLIAVDKDLYFGEVLSLTLLFAPFAFGNTATIGTAPAIRH